LARRRGSVHHKGTKKDSRKEKMKREVQIDPQTTLLSRKYRDKLNNLIVI
jgi:hypothetical protein